MTARGVLVLRIAVSAGAAALAIAHAAIPAFTLDHTTLILFGIALLPWLSHLVRSIELPGIGRVEWVESRVRDVQQEQVALRGEIEALRFLVSGFVTDWELVHLRKLATPEPFHYQRGPDRDDRFVQELVRLRDLGLISKLTDASLFDLPIEGDLKRFVKLTDRGRAYLELRRQMAT